MDTAYRPRHPFLIPDHDIVQLYPVTPVLRVIHVDVHISEYYIQSQIFAGNELQNAYQLNFRSIPVRVNILNPVTGAIVSTVNPGIQE